MFNIVKQYLPCSVEKNTYSTNMLKEDILHSPSYIQIYFITIEYLQFSSKL